MMTNEKKLLTPTELEIMNYFWRLEKATVRDVLQLLPADRKLAYTSVSTIARILEKKGHLGSEKEGKTHVYFPMISKEDYEVQALDSVVGQVFDGTPLSLVKCLVEKKGLSANELKELKKLINKK